MAPKGEVLRMLLKSNTEWKRWGVEDPLWGVATEPGRERSSPTAWKNEEFYSTGESDWRDFFARWRQYGVEFGTCLEIGCGTGRITKQLSCAFGTVYAVDVSPAMIAYARSAILANNVEYCLTDGLDLPHADRSVTAVFSSHVFQHLDNSGIAVAYFREIYRVLDFGGTVMIHLPLYDWPGFGRIAAMLRMAHSLLLKVSNGLAWVKRRAQIRMMRGTAFDSRWLYASLTDLGFRDIELRTFATSRNGVIHSFVMARKNGQRSSLQATW